MKYYQLALQTNSHTQLVDITREVQHCLKESGIGEGLLTVYCPHTTAAITINENADPDVGHDLLKQLEQMVPWRQPFYRHNEDNSAAHVKSSLLGVSQSIPVALGRLQLGRWQGIYFCEFDGPRRRNYLVTIGGE